MARATLFSPIDNTRVAVEIGSPKERELFAKGYKLETPSQNFQTFQNPTREITRGEGNQLYTSEGGVNTPISGPSQLSPLVQQGYQDTRRQLNLPVTTGGDQRTVQTGVIPAATALSTSGNIYQRFNDAVTNILLGMKGDGNLDLEQQRNALIRARFTTKSGPTPEELRVLTPEQQSALRGQAASGIEEQLGGVTSAISARDKERKFLMDSAISLLDRANEAAKLGYEMSKDEKAEARKSHEYMLTNFGSGYIEAMTPEERRNVESALGLGSGVLDKMGATLKEQKQAEYQSGIVGEYQFFADQEKAAGRVPISFNEYQNIDANRKKSIARAGASTTYVAPGVNMDDFRAEAARAVTRLKSGEPWGTVWRAVKALFPSATDQLIDDTLGKEQWIKAGAYEEYRSKAKAVSADNPFK